MLIHALKEYEEFHKSGLPDYYASQPVRWAYHLDKKQWERLSTDDPKPDRPPMLIVPYVKRTNGGNPMFISDQAEYVLGISEADQVKKASKHHCNYLNLLKHAADNGVAIATTVLEAVQTLKPPAGMDPADRIVFYVGGKCLTHRTVCQAFWILQQGNRLDVGEVLPCSCCGTPAKTVRLITEWLKGVPKSLKGACQLISANAASAERYGREKAMGAYLCSRCAQDSMRGLNRLTTSADKLVLGDALVLHWGSSVPFYEVMRTPTQQLACELRSKPFMGRSHVLILSAHQSRAVVRLFEIMDADILAKRLATWIETQGENVYGLLDHWVEEKGKKKKLLGLLNYLHPNRDLARVATSPVVDAVSTVVLGTPLPSIIKMVAEHLVLQGIRDEKMMNDVLAAMTMIKLSTKFPLEGDMTANINMADTPAYRCGQLIGQLERTQKAAIPNINRTIADNALRTIGPSPRAVLGEALSNAKAHLSKLYRMRRAGPYLESINSCLEGLEIPERFTAADQVAICLGYYSVFAARTYKKDEPEPETAEA